jgi:hypothetical protein
MMLPKCGSIEVGSEASPIRSVCPAAGSASSQSARAATTAWRMGNSVRGVAGRLIIYRPESWYYAHTQDTRSSIVFSVDSKILS